ncbi:Obg family GTPase CgtA, partial [Candidatus Saccharibacteria bacterium]|nr:Obg family GTPase CgtA [Candidatus Saccharibacteria bacterium]
VIRRALAHHSAALVAKPEVIALTKIDAVPESTVKQQLECLHRVTESPIYPIAAPARSGTLELLRHLAEVVERQKAEQTPISQADASSGVEIKLDSRQLATSWWVSRRDDGSYLVTGEKIERFAERTDFDSEFSINRLRDILAKLNIVAELVKQGATGESVVEIAGHRFPLQEQWDDVS